MFEKFIKWCRKSTPAAKLEHTIFQGVIGAVVVVVPQLVGLFNLPEWATALIVALIMAVLTPVMAAAGNGGKIDEVVGAGEIDESEHV